MWFRTARSRLICCRARDSQYRPVHRHNRYLKLNDDDDDRLVVYLVASNTVFTWSDVVDTIYFIIQFCAVSIWEQRLIESGVYWYQWTWPLSPDHSHIFIVHRGSGDGEKSDPFADIKEDEDRLENEILLEDCLPYTSLASHTPFMVLLYYTALLLCAHATRIVAAASIREWPLLLSAHLEVRLLFENGD